MKIIKLDATESTNQYLKDLTGKNQLEDFTVVRCDHQLKGKGQRGNVWISEKGKNLTMSVLKHFLKLDVSRVFYLNMATSLAIVDVLSVLSVPELKVKWPNDIMSGDHKICGILVETLLKGSYIASCIIGVGLNVNQTKFENLERAGSLKNSTGSHFDLDQLMFQILVRLQHQLNLLEQHPESLLQEYQKSLFKKDITSSFQTPEGTTFQGKIIGVGADGNLLVLKQNGTTTSYATKEVQLIY